MLRGRFAMAKASGAPGPTPDPAPAPPPVRAGVGEDARSASSDASGANDGWLDSLWRKTQKDAEETIKFIEEEHKKNVQKFEQGLNEIKTTAEELADGFTSQLEGRKSLKLLREETAAAEAATAAAQVKLVAASKETQLAEEALRDATAKGARASGQVLERAKAARSSLLLARSEFSAARAETSRREDAVRAAEVALAESAEKRNLMHLLFKRKLTPEEREEQRMLLEESRRLKAVVAIQRNFRAARAKRRAAARAAERRRKLRASCVRLVKTALSFFALYVFLVLAASGAARALAARHAAYARVADSAAAAARAARALAPLDHGYLRGGLASRLELGEHVVLRDRNRALGARVDVLERELASASAALAETHAASPCGGCARDAAARLDAEERARAAEQRAGALSLEVIALRATATTLGAGDKEVRRLAKSGASQAWLADPSVGFSAQVAAAATAAAAVTTEARVADAVAAAREAEEEAEAAKVENEVLRALIDEGLVPGAKAAGAGAGACWAAVSEAKAEARVSAAASASAHAQQTAERLMGEKLAAYAEARREAERESEAYKVELDALKAAAPELRVVADEAEAEEARRLDDPPTASYAYDAPSHAAGGSAASASFKREFRAAQTRRTVVGAAKLVAAAKLASERVAQAAAALRDAESRAEVRRVELETLRALVAGNGTAGVVERAERYVSELPGAVARAREAVERRAADRLRTEEEARAQAETRAEVFRVELASVRELEVTRAKDLSKRGSSALPPIFSRSGEISALTAEVARLEKALAAATAKPAATPAGPPPATPESATAAARVAAVAAADAAAEAEAARERLRDTTPLVRRFAGWIVAGVLGEDPATRDALRRRVASLEKRLDAVRVAAAAGPGSVCESALADAADATRRAEQRADAVAIDLDAARNVSLALAAGRGEESAVAGAAEALMAAADKHRKLLAAERSAARATLESCRGHAAAASQRAFVASKAAADTSDLFERHKLRLAAEALEARQEEAMLASLAPATAPADGGDSAVGVAAGFDAAATAAAAEAALEAIEEADLRAEALSRKFREAESRWRLAPGTLDSYEPREYTRDDAYLFAFFSAALSGLAVLAASRSAIPWLALAKARLLAQAAALASVRHGLKRAEYDAEVMRERAEIAETATNEARAEAARRLYVDFEDDKNLGTVVDEMRANLRKTSELNEAVRNDNDWLRAKLREARDAQAAFMAAPEGGWANLRKVEEEQSSELAKLRVEVERLRSARLDATAVAAAAVREHLKAHPDESTTFASIAGDLKLGSPSFRAGMSAAREAAEREAAALRDESEALREANDRLLAESARLRLENHDLMEDLGGDGAPGVTAREAARAIREEMLEMTAVADAHAETIAAERAARAELAGRVRALAGEATRERRAQAKVYLLGACVAAGCAATSGASYGVLGVEPITGKASETAAFAAVSVAGLAAACLGSWALVFSAPNGKIKRLAAPVECVALVDEELVVPSEAWAREAANAEAEAEAADAADAVEPAAEAETNAARATAAASTASTSAAAPVPSASEAAGPTQAGRIPASDDEELVLDDAEASAVGRAIRRVWRPETDVEEEAARAARDADIAALRAELAGVRATADRLRQSRDRLKRRAHSARNENDALHSARDEVHSQAETMSLARSSGAGFGASSAYAGTGEERARSDAEASAREAREKSLRAQLAELRAVNERMDRELASLRRGSEEAAAEAEAAAASSALEEHLSESESGSRAGTRASSPAPIRGDGEAKRAMVELPLALERAARAESRAAQVEASRAAAVAAAADERRALAAAKEAAAKEVEWLKAARERLLREVATLRSSNVAVERDLRLSHERVAMLEEDARENYGVASSLERKLHEAKRRAEDLEEKKSTLERDRKLHEERAAAAIAAAEASHASSRAADGARDADLDALERAEKEKKREKESRALLERELEEVASSKRALEAETRALRALVESRDEASATARAQATRAQEDVRLARERNAALSRELAQAREELLVAREEATLSPAKTQIAEALREEVDRLAARVKEAYVREAELKRQLAAVARAALAKAASSADAAAASAKEEDAKASDERAETEAGSSSSTRADDADDAARTDPAEAPDSAPAASTPALSAFLAQATSMSRGEDARAPGVAEDFRRRLAEDEKKRRRAAEDVPAEDVSPACASGGGVPGDGTRPPTRPRPNPKRSVSSAFANAPQEKRYRAKRRAVDVLCAAVKPDTGATGGADDDPEARASRRRVARRSLAATARVMRGAAAFAALKSGALPNALALMAAAPKDRNAQISGCRVIAACVADAALSTHAKRSPSFAGGGALRAAAAALRRHGAEDASAARAAARAMWTAVHLGGRAAQEEMFRSDGAHTVPPLLAAMRAHAEDASVTEACCGCLLASALGFELGQDALAGGSARAAIEDATRAAAERGHPMRFGGAFAGLEQWIDVPGGL